MSPFLQLSTVANTQVVETAAEKKSTSVFVKTINTICKANFLLPFFFLNLGGPIIIIIIIITLVVVVVVGAWGGGSGGGALGAAA